MVGGYVLLNLAYTLYLKQMQIIDAMIVACGFIIRLEAGAVAGEIELSHWLIIMTFILSVSRLSSAGTICVISWRPDRFHVRILPDIRSTT